MYPRSSLEPHSLLTHRTTYNHFIFFFFSFHGCRYTLNDKIVSRTQRTETSSEQPRHTIQRSFSTERFPICRKTIGEHLHRGLFHARDRPLSLSLSLERRQNLSAGSKVQLLEDACIGKIGTRIDNEDRILICHRRRFMSATLRASRFSRNISSRLCAPTHPRDSFRERTIFLPFSSLSFAESSSILGLVLAALLCSSNAINY